MWSWSSYLEKRVPNLKIEKTLTSIVDGDTCRRSHHQTWHMKPEGKPEDVLAVTSYIEILYLENGIPSRVKFIKVCDTGSGIWSWSASALALTTYRGQHPNLTARFVIWCSMLRLAQSPPQAQNSGLDSFSGSKLRALYRMDALLPMYVVKHLIYTSPSDSISNSNLSLHLNNFTRGESIPGSVYTSR